MSFVVETSFVVEMVIRRCTVSYVRPKSWVLDDDLLSLSRSLSLCSLSLSFLPLLCARARSRSLALSRFLSLSLALSRSLAPSRALSLARERSTKTLLRRLRDAISEIVARLVLLSSCAPILPQESGGIVLAGVCGPREKW